MGQEKLDGKVVELFQRYGLAGFFFAIAIRYLVQFIETEQGLSTAILFAVVGSVAAFLNDISKAILKPVSEKLSESISDTIIRWLEISWVSVASPFQRDYYKALLFAFSDYRTQGLDIGSRVLELERLFVPLGITSPEGEDISAGLIQSDDDIGNYALWDFLVDGVENPSLRHQALLAPPGSGKTTLLKHLIVTYVKNTHRKQHRQAPKLIPVFISLREICTTVARSHPPLPRLLERQDLIRRCKPPENWFEPRLRKGQCLMMFDGLDEIADVEERQAVSQWINEQIAAFPDSYFIVTSRPLGYRSVQLRAIRRVLKVEPFTLKQIERFIHSWYVQNELLRLPRSTSTATRASQRQAQKTAQLKATDLFDRIKDSPPLAAMALNPLLLTMMTTVHNYRAVLPENRVRLYGVIYDVLIEQRQRDRDIYNQAIANKTKKLLQTLALAMMEGHTPEYRVADDTPSLHSTMPHLLGDELSLDEFLIQTDSAHGLLVKKTEGVYEFAHESFRNYLAAVQIQALGKDDELLQRVSEVWWFDTIYLYAAQNQDATAIVRAALKQSTAESLNLAYTLDQDGVPIAPDVAQSLRQTVDEGLQSSDPDIFNLAAEVKLSNRLNQLLRLSDKIEIDQVHITQAEYQMFLDERPHSLCPDHWTSDRFLPEQAQSPVTGVRAKDAQAFCDWLTQKKAKPELRFTYRLPRLTEVKEHPSREAETGCWCDDLRDKRVAGLQAAQWQRWQGTFSTHLRDYVERDRPHLQVLTRNPDFQISLDLESDTGFQLAFDPSLDIAIALERVFVLDLDQAFNLAQSRPVNTSLENDNLLNTIRTCNRTVTMRETRAFNRDYLLHTRHADFQPIRNYLLLTAEFWQALADAHASLAQNRQDQKVVRYFPKFATRIVNYPLNRIRSECIVQRDRVMNLYAFFALLEARKEGKMPAWEGIRIVREVARRSA